MHHQQRQDEEFQQRAKTPNLKHGQKREAAKMIQPSDRFD